MLLKSLGSMSICLVGSYMSGMLLLNPYSMSMKSSWEKRHCIFCSGFNSLYLLYSPPWSAGDSYCSSATLIYWVFWIFWLRVLRWETISFAFSKACFWYYFSLERFKYCVRFGSNSEMKWSFMKSKRIGYTGLNIMFFGLKIFWTKPMSFCAISFSLLDM